MLLPISENCDFSDECLAYEIGTAFRCVEMGYSAITTGDYEALIVGESKRIAESVMNYSDVEHNLYKDILRLRDYSINGKFDDDIKDPQDLYGLILMSAPASELYGGSIPYSCSAVLQAVVARSKIDRLYHKEILPTLDLIAPCQGFSSGDHFSGMTLYELSLLSQMTLQGVKNELRKPGSPKTRYESDSENDLNESNLRIPKLVTIDIEEAYSWLKGRRGFIDTYIANFGEENNEDTYLVPQAKDGSFFSFSCKLSRGFKIGKKGEEVYVEDFEEALKQLQQMPKPYWRRPSPSSGIAGIVSGSTWIHKKFTELK